MVNPERSCPQTVTLFVKIPQGIRVFGPFTFRHFVTFTDFGDPRPHSGTDGGEIWRGSSSFTPVFTSCIGAKKIKITPPLSNINTSNESTLGLHHRSRCDRFVAGCIAVTQLGFQTIRYANSSLVENR